MTSATEASNPSTPTSVFQHVIVQPGHLVQIPKTQASREENAKNNGILCKFYITIQMHYSDGMDYSDEQSLSICPQ